MKSITKQAPFKRQVAKGIFVLGIRRVLYQAILTGSNIMLARILTPGIFGAFAIISFLVITPGILTNFGLGPAIIQKKKNLSKEELQSVFTVLILSPLVLTILIYIFTPLISSFYMGKLSEDELFWLRVFPLSLSIAHASSISMRLLDRGLEFTKVTIGEICMLCVTQVTTIILALKGFGVGSFVLGNFTGGVLGFFLFYYLSPWPIGFRFSFKNLKPLLPFGLNYQANNLIGAINNAVVPIFIGAVSGPTAVGLVTWASGIRQVGLAPFDVVERVIFPTISRAQGDTKLLQALIEKLTRISCMLSFPLLATFFALAMPMTEIVYTSKWIPGITALYLSLLQGIFLLLGTMMVDVLLAIGQAKTVRNISLFWAILQWTFTIPLVLLWDFNGVMFASLLVSLTFFIPLMIVKKYIQFTILPSIIPYVLYSIILVIFLFLVGRVFVITSILELFLVGGLGFFVYCAILLIFERKHISKDLRHLKMIYE